MIRTNKLIITMLILLAIILVPNTANAALQANKGGTSLVNTYASNFFKGIRQMETANGTLGVTSSIDTETSYLDSSKNGIDCHMAKNTEWGTAAMLAASVYGTAPSGQSNASTTGNETGIYQMADGKWEYVAGIYSKDSYSYDVGIIKAADERYRNLYTSETSIAGDATLQTKNWYSASNASFVTSASPVFLRSYSALFGYDRSYGSGYSNYTSRAVVVCGAGL